MSDILYPEVEGNNKHEREIEMKKHTVSVDGNKKSDKAIQMWQDMSAMERFNVMSNVRDYKSIERKHSACINYIFENMV